MTSPSQEIPTGTRIYFERPGTGYIAAAVIGSDGSFDLKHKREKEIEPGDYTVFIGPPPSNLSEKEFYALQTKVNAEFRKQGKKPPPSPDWVLPVEYYQSQTSPLRQAIQPGDNSVTIEIK